MTGWTIAAAELRIPWGTRVAAHRMLVVVDPVGRVVRQFNGLASWFDKGSGRWRHKPIGYLPSDRLRGYDTAAHPQTFLPVHGAVAGPQPGGLDVRAALASGVVARMPGGSGLGPDELEARLALVKRLIADVNALAPGPDGGAGLPYPFLGFGPNSNSFFETARETMGLGSPEFPERAWLVPGAERLLLPPQEIARIRSEVQSGSPATIGARKEAIASATRSAPSAVG